MELQSESLAKLVPALVKAKKEFKPFTKAKTVKVNTRTGGGYSYSYADLETINDSVQEALHDNGLVIVQQTTVQEGNDLLVTTLMHESGEFLRGIMTLPTRSDADHQERGSAITYTRRYAITSLLNLTADDDDDARATRAPKTKAAPNDVKENFKVERNISEDEVDKLIAELKRSGVEGNPVKFAKKVITRDDWNQLAELTKGEAYAVIAAARKDKAAKEEGK